MNNEHKNVYTFKSVLVTGGCGFIGSNFLIYFVKNYPDTTFINIDKLTYCSNKQYLCEIEKHKNYKFIQSNINNHDFISHILIEYNIDTVVHFAAQSHVDHSFRESLQYTQDNVVGTHSLLETCYIYGNIRKFIHVSTDEVYGESNVDEDKKTTRSILEPTNPYSATKAAAEHIAGSYYKSFGFPVIITRGNNVYGKFQYPEKIIPKFVLQCFKNKPVTIQGNGLNLRSYIYVDDVVRAFETILKFGKTGEIYNIGSDNEYSNLEIAQKIIKIVKGHHLDYTEKIKYIEDRNFNDKRYYISSSNLEDLSWKPEKPFDEGLKDTINWYIDTGFPKKYWDIDKLKY